MSSSLSVVIPVYNEAAIIAATVETCLASLAAQFDDYELILVDDGSTDGTSEILRSLSHSPAVVLLDNHVNLNAGIAIQRGFAVARMEYIVHNGADLPLDMNTLSELVDLMADCDVLVVERAEYSGAAAYRRFISRVNRALIAGLFPLPGLAIRDFNFTQIYRQSIMAGILPLARGPSFTTPEMIIRAVHLGHRVKSITVAYQARPVGVGAFGKPHDILWAFYDMCRFRLRLRSVARPGKGT